MSNSPRTSPSAVLAQWAPLPVPVQRLVLERFPALRTPMASNVALAPEVWTELYAPGVDAATAERLLWRSDLDEERVSHALVTRSERRKAPLAALLGAAPRLAAPHLEAVASDSLSTQTADLLLSSTRLPATLRRRVAPSASYRVGVLSLLRDHRSFSDDEALAVLVGCGPRARWSRNNWAIVPGMLADRPALRDRLAASDPVPLLAWAAARVGVSGAAQGALLDTVLAYPASDRSVVLNVVEALYAHPHTTPETAARIEALAASSALVTSAVRGVVPRPWGCDLTQLADPARVEDLLSVASASPSAPADRVWMLVLLARSPHLTPDQRARLEALLALPEPTRQLANCAEPALLRARTGEGELVPVTSWRVGSRVGDTDALAERLGPRTRYVPDTLEASTWAGDLTLTSLGRTSPSDTWTLDEVGGHVAHALGSDVEAWEIALSLADTFDGTVDDLLAAARALATER